VAWPEYDEAALVGCRAGPECACHREAAHQLTGLGDNPSQINWRRLLASAAAAGGSLDSCGPISIPRVSPKLRDPFTVIYEWRQRLIPDRIWYAVGALTIAIGSIVQGLSFHLVIPAVLTAVAVVLVVLQIRRTRADTGGNTPDDK
jgi:hypothetical protein